MTREYLNNFVLVGGTNLALQLGHRFTIDLVLFTNSVFNAEELDKMFEKGFRDEGTTGDDRQYINS